MTALPTYFIDFLREIRPSDPMRKEYKAAHTLLRKRLREFDTIKDALVATFLQGSYRRWTLHRPTNGKKADVDIIVVTKLDPKEWTPGRVLALFTLFAKKYYDGKYEVQGRSIRITLSDVCLDIVPVAAASEAEVGVLTNVDVETLDDLEEDVEEGRAFQKSITTREAKWKTEPLLIPDREVKEWIETHPLKQIAWARNRNAESSGHYVNVMKAAKWMRQRILPDVKHPKGYPLERAFDECFPTGDVSSVGEALTLMLENFVSQFRVWGLMNLTPTLEDRGLPGLNVMKRVAGNDFGALYRAIVDAAALARAALNAETVKESAEKWRELLGDKFPAPPDEDDDRGVPGGFTPRTGPSAPRPARYA